VREVFCRRDAEGGRGRAGNWGDDWGNLFFFDIAAVFQPYHLASLKKLEKEGENEGL
jgi:hypothetical protein